MAKWRSWCRQFRASVRRRCKKEMVATKATSTESATCHRACTGNPMPTHNNLKNRIRLQARRGRWGRTTVLVKWTKAPPPRRALVIPFLTSCLWALPVCLSENGFSMEDRQNRDSSPFLTRPFPFLTLLGSARRRVHPSSLSGLHMLCLP